MLQTNIIIGAAGFIGSHLTEHLLVQGHYVIGVDDFSLGKKDNLRSCVGHKSFQLVECDASNLAELNQKVNIENPASTIIWHLAANSDIRAGVADANVDLNKTFLTTFAILEWMKSNELEHIAFSSTSAVYGHLKSPIAEDDGPLFPASNYGAMKLASEATISAACEAFLKKAWVFRFPNVIGSHATHGVIYDLFHKLKVDKNRLEVLGDGTQCKPYLHVSELIEAMCFIVDHAEDSLNYFNIGPQSSPTNVAFIAEEIIRASGLNAKMDYTGGKGGWVGDVPQFDYDTSKLNHLGWKPVLSSDEAISKAILEVGKELGVICN